MDLFNTLTSFQAMQPTKPRDSKPPRITLNDVMLEIKSIHSRLDKIESRLDNLVSKNNLKE